LLSTIGVTGRSQQGFALIELLVVVAVIGILAAIALTVYGNVHQRTRIAKAQADGRALATAVSVYAAHTGSLPTALSELTTQVTNGQGYVAGPFILALPPAPQGWTPYAYTANTATLAFSITASGDGASVAVP
jgi:prepilin-type N-terminal cleavage/methylation domain-containing protein